ncbi:MAG: DNA pilot protein [Microviridae sp.]|nr:MAG: DNA pilot protein [Microviridae sp.]
MPYIEQLGQQMATGGAGGILGLMFGGLQNQQQYNQQERLQQLQIKGQKEMSDYNYAKQLQMWHDTNYWAQIEELKKAGLNPALLYGMSGGGGTTTGSGQGNVSGGTAAARTDATQMGMGLMQIGLMEAQKEKLKAETENIKADTTNKPIQGTNIQADTKLKEAETALKNVENTYQNKSLEDRLDTINTIALNAIVDYDRNRTQLGLDRATVLQKAELIKQQAIGASLQNILTENQTQEVKSKIAANYAQIQKWSQEIAQGWKELSIKEKTMKVEALMKEVEQWYSGSAPMRAIFGQHDRRNMAAQIDEIMNLGRQKDTAQ